MKKINYLLPCFILLMAGCGTKWEQPGATDPERKADYADCRKQGYEKFRPDMVTGFSLDFKKDNPFCNGFNGCAEQNPEFSFAGTNRS